MDAVRSPLNFELIGNFPDPFNSMTNIEFTLQEECIISLEIYDLLGRKITTLATGLMDAGKHTVAWRTVDVSSGIYYTRMSVNGKAAAVDKMVLLKQEKVNELRKKHGIIAECGYTPLLL